MTISALLVLLASLTPAQAYYGRHSTEAVLTFHAAADVRWQPTRPEDSPVTPVTLDELNSDTPERRQAVARVDEQILHLMGTFQSRSFIDEFGYPGALGETHELRFSAVRDGSGEGRKLFEYDFRGVVVFHKDSFDGHPSRLVPLKLPLAPDLIYGLSVERSHGSDRNRCTDRSFNGPEDFWYYWDPDQPACPLAGDNTVIVRVDGRLDRLPNTRVSYPEYDRLYGDKGSGPALSIAVFIGYIRAQDDDSTEINRHDEAVKAFHFVERDLAARGFELTSRQDNFRVADDGSLTDGINFLRVFGKTVDYGDSPLKVNVLLVLTDTDSTSEDQTFVRYASHAMSEADIFIYDGHSGLGKNVDLSRFPGLALDPEKYQIFVFNGCSTYPYFNGMYFRAKGGSRNLDVITSGLPELATSSGPNISAFMAPFLDARTLSYQKILSDLEDSNGEEAGTYLVGVKGDEDNEWHP